MDVSMLYDTGFNVTWQHLVELSHLRVAQQIINSAQGVYREKHGGKQPGNNWFYHGVALLDDTTTPEAG